MGRDGRAEAHSARAHGEVASCHSNEEWLALCALGLGHWDTGTLGCLEATSMQKAPGFSSTMGLLAGREHGGGEEKIIRVGGSLFKKHLCLHGQSANGLGERKVSNTTINHC